MEFDVHSIDRTALPIVEAIVGIGSPFAEVSQFKLMRFHLFAKNVDKNALSGPANQKLSQGLDGAVSMRPINGADGNAEHLSERIICLEDLFNSRTIRTDGSRSLRKIHAVLNQS